MIRQAFVATGSMMLIVLAFATLTIATVGSERPPFLAFPAHALSDEAICSGPTAPTVTITTPIWSAIPDLAGLTDGLLKSGDSTEAVAIDVDRKISSDATHPH